MLTQLAQMASIAIENARQRRGARGQPHEGRVPGDALARAAHAAQRDPRLDAAPARGASSTPSGPTRGLEVIERNARAQTQLIDDLLDVSRIITGKLRLERRSRLALAAVIEAALDAVRPAAEAQADRACASTARADAADRILGRSGPAAAGRLEPALERDQVHAARAAASTVALRRVDDAGRGRA